MTSTCCGTRPRRNGSFSIFFLTGTARRMHGFVDALWAIDFQIPDAPGPAVYVVPKPGVLGRYDIGLEGSGVGVYVK